jgi:hypothetical protein
MGWTHDRARVAALSRHRKPDDPALGDARRDLAAKRLTEFVRRVVAAAPPLTPEQRDIIAALLRTPGSSGDGEPDATRLPVQRKPRTARREVARETTP